ncbi:MAG TPA: tetratricopeptide repeat protein [Allosphingosinicella sp.]|nr:tetratricopeptide repeat protein [Allosphingosinicella sp.]
MRFGIVFLFTAAAAFSAPALSSVTVIGNSSAQSCFKAADSPARPTVDQLRQCDRALGEEALSRRDLAATHVNRGVILVRMGRMGDAMHDFDAAMAIDPNEPESYLNKGAAMMRTGRPGEALPLFSMALQKNTRRPALAYYGRGVAHEDLGDVQSAYMDYRRASTANPEWNVPREELARFAVRARR